MMKLASTVALLASAGRAIYGVAADESLAFLQRQKDDLTSLRRLHIDTSKISVSGLSSGADFAVQFQVAFSKSIMGVGVFAGSPYGCQTTYF